MIETELTVPVFILTEDDVSEITDENRATGKLTKAVEALEEVVHAAVGARVTVSVGFTNQPRYGAVPHVNVAGVKLTAGQAIAFLPTGPARVPVPKQEPKPKPAKKAAKKQSYKSED